MNNYEEFAKWYNILLGDFETTRQSYVKMLNTLLYGRKELIAIDIGCGTGIYLSAAREVCAGAIGIDISENMIAECKNIGTDGKGGIVRASWFELPLKENLNANVICMGNSIAHCLNYMSIEKVFREFCRVVGKGVIIVDIRNLEKVSEFPRNRVRGEGVLQGIKYTIYDTWVVKERVYEITFRIIKCENGKDSEVLGTTLRYWKNCGRAMEKVVKRVGLEMISKFTVNDLGDLFDVIVLKKCE